MEQPPSRPTLRDIAAASNVSASAVSLALRNHPSIPSSTCQRIQGIAREMGYRPNPSVVTLMAQVRSGHRVKYRETLGWINAWDRADFFQSKKPETSEYARQLWKGAFERAAELGYTLDSFWLKAPRMNGRKMSAILKARGIRGLLIPPLPKAYGHLSIDWSEFAATALSHTIVRPLLHRVAPDHHYNMQIILRALRRHGFKKIGLLIPPHYDERSENHIRSAFYFYQQGIAVRNRVPVLLCDPPLNTACHTWLKKYQPEAVITIAGFKELRKISVSTSNRLEKPGVALIGYNASIAGFAAVDENPALIGATGVDHLAGQLNRNERGIPDSRQTILVKGTWVDGHTLIKKQTH